jgi:hypothetical protein
MKIFPHHQLHGAAAPFPLAIKLMSPQEQHQVMSSRLSIHVPSFLLVLPLDYVIGINKPGGAARIRSVSSDGLYSVTYILGGKEDNIEIQYITKREEYEGRPMRKRPSAPAGSSTEIKSLQIAPIPKKPRKVLSKISPNISKRESSQTPSISSSCMTHSNQKVRTPSSMTRVESEIDDNSLSGESNNSRSTYEKPVIHSEKTKMIISEFFPAVRKCRATEDDEYLVSDIEQYFVEKFGVDISAAFEEALSYFESANLIMMMGDDLSRRQLVII